LFLLSGTLPAQQSAESDSGSTDAVAESASMPDPEEALLRRAMMEAQGSQIDIVRGLERHLKQFPSSKRREEIELVLLKASTEVGDNNRILRYGQAFLDTGANDLATFDRVLPLVLRDSSEAASRKALAYAKRYETAARSLAEHLPSPPPQRLSAIRRHERALSRSLVFQARANGNLGNYEEALRLAEASYALEPTAEAAREMGKWLHAQGRTDEAIARYAEAFTIVDSLNDEAHRSADRKRLGELYRERHETERGLGDVILAAYDRTRVHVEERRKRLASIVPNADVKHVTDFTLSSLDNNPLPLSSLRGKVVVVDFWATWCGPCRRQHPLYEQVLERFKHSDKVRFLSVNTDEDRSLVQPFLEENGWKQPVFFEDGLAGFLRISSIPTTLILGADGEIFSRLNGYIPETFVDVLTARVNEALSEQSAMAQAQ
jgi:thiol-disulfide isomerase/thioredoxin